MRFFKSVAFLAIVVLATAGHAGFKEKYNFRENEAYKQLSEEDRGKLEQVHRDLTMLWGALDRYADGHDGNPPKKLEELVPGYLAELPTDPFATMDTARQKPTGNLPSKNGWGYRYRIGPMIWIEGRDTRRSWVLASVGLSEFPYNAARGNIGLYIAKGIWF